MSKKTQKTLLIFKRYGVPIGITLGIYTAIYFLCGAGVKYINIGLWIALLYACLMRFCDDITDYEKDVAADKAPIKKQILIISAAIAVALIVALSVVGALWWLMLPLVWIGLLFVVKGLAADLLKPLFTPTVVIALTVCVFEINIFTWILSAVLIVLDGILIYKRRK